MATGGKQYLRRCSLILTAPAAGNNPNEFVAGEDKAIDLSQFQLKFQTAQQDEESPNNCTIRVYNLSDRTVKKVRDEYSHVVLQAGYEGGAFGVIFQGTIKQFRVGRLDNKTTYLDILAADGDMAYNFAIVKKTLAAGSRWQDRVNAAAKAMEPMGVTLGQVEYPDAGGILPRGKVLFGYAKAALRSNVQTMGATWSIQNGKINIIPLTGYLPGESVILTSGTGLIGRPEQTIDGIKARCLLNPKIVVGGSVKIDNESINQTVQQKDHVIPGAQLPFNQWAGIQQFATIATDGLYRVYVAEHKGDTRGQEWYTDIVCLTIDPVTNTCKAYG
jgi:hypothetical protein